MPEPKVSLLEQLRALQAKRSFSKAVVPSQIAQLRGNKLVELFFNTAESADLRKEFEQLMHDMRQELIDNLGEQNQNIADNKAELQENIDANNDAVWTELKRRMEEYLIDKDRFVDSVTTSAALVSSKLDTLTEVLGNKDFCCTNGSVSTNGLFTFYMNENGQLCAIVSGILDVDFTINEEGILEGTING